MVADPKERPHKCDTLSLIYYFTINTLRIKFEWLLYCIDSRRNSQDTLNIHIYFEIHSKYDILLTIYIFYSLLI